MWSSTFADGTVPVLDGIQPSWLQKIIPARCRHDGKEVLEVHFMASWIETIGPRHVPPKLDGVRGCINCRRCGALVYLPRARYDAEIVPLCQDWLREQRDIALLR